MLPNSIKAQSDTLLITSQSLGHDIRVVVHDMTPEVADKPIVYFTDGEKMIEKGALTQLGQLTQSRRIAPAYYVFVSTIDPATQADRRNDYFFCNPKYLTFFEEELLPTVEASFGRTFGAQDRSLVGVSFGGLNAAYFSAHSSQFQHYGLLSPITYPCPSVMQDLAFSKNEALRIFLSTGQQDAEQYLRPLEQMYTSNDYQVRVRYTDGGHDFENWNAQLEEVLNFFQTTAQTE